MKVVNKNISLNRYQISATSGDQCPSLISNAINIQSLSEDLVLEDQNGQQIPFVIIPLSEGAITVELVGNTSPYVIQEAEVTASLGLPLFYLVRKVFKTGTTVTNMNVGF